MDKDHNDAQFKKYLYTRVIAGLLIAMIVLAAFGSFMFFVQGSPGLKALKAEGNKAVAKLEQAFSGKGAGLTPALEEQATSAVAAPPLTEKEASVSGPPEKEALPPDSGGGPEVAAQKEIQAEDEIFEPPADEEPGEAGSEALFAMDSKGKSSIQRAREAGGLEAAVGPPGAAFVRGIIQPLKYELTERYYGWRPNDLALFKFGDNVEHIQLGVLAVTRLGAKALKKDFSPATPELAQAVTQLEVDPKQYWFPSSKSAYMDGIANLEVFEQKLNTRQVRFSPNASKLLPLLINFDNLLSRCLDELLRNQEEDGKPVRGSRADDYFYFSKGVALAMASVLDGAGLDFEAAMRRNNAAEELGRCADFLGQAAGLDPFIIFNSPYDGFWANHRANMAAPMARARAHIQALIRALEE